jgi:hypothetical protein
LCTVRFSSNGNSYPTYNVKYQDEASTYGYHAWLAQVYRLGNWRFNENTTRSFCFFLKQVRGNFQISGKLARGQKSLWGGVSRWDTPHFWRAGIKTT